MIGPIFLNIAELGKFAIIKILHVFCIWSSSWEPTWVANQALCVYFIILAVVLLMRFTFG